MIQTRIAKSSFVLREPHSSAIPPIFPADSGTLFFNLEAVAFQLTAV